MAKKYGNKQQLEKEGSSFNALKAGSYIARFSSLEIKEKKDFSGNMVDTLCLQFSPYEANARTAVIKDVEGNTIQPLTRKLFQDINKITMGFRENFTIPSRYRSLVSAFQNMDPNDDVEGPDELTVESAAEQLDEYFGDYVVVNVIVTEKNGNKRNKITDFQPVPEDFEADPVVEKQAEDAAKKKAEGKRRDATAAPVEDEEDMELEEGSANKDEAEPKAKKNTKKALF